MCGGRWIWLLYLNGYSAGGEEERVKLLKCGIGGLWIGRLADSGCRNMRFVERFYDSPVAVKAKADSCGEQKRNGFSVRVK